MKTTLDMSKAGNAFSLKGWQAWLPFVAFTIAAMTVRNRMPAWVWMWGMAGTIYAICKGVTLSRAVKARNGTHLSRAIAYLLLWPGMDAVAFLDSAKQARKPAGRNWMQGTANFIFGTILFWVAARLVGHGLLAGWIGMTGILFILHFGLFNLLGCFWRLRGISAAPIMRMPAAMGSVRDFWGRRWNSAFRDLTFGLLFAKIARLYGARSATLIAFFISGLVHELVITIPAQGGYGLPTAYFTLQGVAMLFERSHTAARLHLRGTWRGRLFAYGVTVLPVLFLFPPPFVTRVVIPFMQATGAL